MIITSKSNAKIKEIASLKDKKFRKKSGLYVVEGYKMVSEALSNQKGVKLLVGTSEGLARFSCFEIDKIEVSEDVFSYVSDAVTPQGVLAVLSEDFVEPKTPIKPCVLLDGISDPGNMGTIIRTCAAAGVKDVYLVDCCDVYSPKVVRSSMSGIFFVNLSILKREDVASVMGDTPIIIADMGGESVFDFNPPDRYCLVIGNEANGVSKEVRSLAAHTVKIPMAKTSESLNAGVSLAILIYEMTEGKNRSLIN